MKFRHYFLLTILLSCNILCLQAQKASSNHNIGEAELKNSFSSTPQNQSSFSNSIYTTRLEDSQAVYFTPENFNIKTDGSADISDELQKAIRQVYEKTGFGILFIPEGEYQISKTIFLPKGVRMIGFGVNRPVFILKKNTPGFQVGEKKYMFWFTSNLPTEDRKPMDANPGTFYSAISNINLKIENGNPAAIGIRSHYAQHSFISHVDFYIGEGKSGIEEVGNELEDCRFFGGEYGIITTKPSPSWPFLMVDTYFEAQRKGAIRTQEGGLTIIRMRVKNAPSVIEINPDQAEELWIEDSQFESISGPAIVVSDEFNAKTFINLHHVVCQKVPILASFRSSGKQVSGPESENYLVTDFCHGNQIEDLGYQPEHKTTFNFEKLKSLPLPIKSDIPQLPPCNTWVNLKSLGAKGDGTTDDTKVLQDAIEKYETIYLPTGRYRITETIKLKTKTVLIGLNPIATQILIKDNTEAFMGNGSPKALLETSQGGANIVTGIGLDAGGVNPRAVAAKWMAGANSYMNDVRFIGGHGTMNADGSPVSAYNANRTGDSNPLRKWDSQYWSLWITNNGGGTFKDIWTPSTFAAAGLYISNTSTPGRIYALSSEHHVRNEIKLKNVSNWKIYALQMEEESGESWNCLPVEIENSSNLLFANLYLYRVIRIVSPFPYGVRIWNSKNLEFRGVHTYSPSKFTYNNTIFDVDHDFEIRSREISKLNISGNAPKIVTPKSSPIKQDGTRVLKVAGGFEFIDGSVADKSGNVYFVDARWRRIYCYSAKTNKLKIVSDMPIQPLALAIDGLDNLLVTTITQNDVSAESRGSRTFSTPIPGSEGTSYQLRGEKIKVFAVDPTDPENSIRELSEVPVNSVKKIKMAYYPGHRWRDNHDFSTYAITPPQTCFLAPDGETIIPNNYDLIRSYSLRKAIPGNKFYIADEFGQKTVSTIVKDDGSLSNLQLFAEEGELGIAEDVEGNVYIAAGEVFVYDKTGKQIDVIHVPERPSTLTFGGNDKKTLFISARSSLYSIQTKYSGK